MKQQVLEKQLRDIRAAIDQMQSEIRGIAMCLPPKGSAAHITDALDHFNKRIDEVLKDADA